MERERKPKQFMEAQVEGRKQRGRQIITFEIRIEETGSRRGKTLEEVKKMARDREVWKSWRKDPRRCNGTNGNGKEEEEGCRYGNFGKEWMSFLPPHCYHN
jgi:hypothetical protein